MRDFPQYYPYFRTQSFTYGGNHPGPQPAARQL
jgi:D-alanyl-D-alanine carboxypeptidase